MNNFTRKNTNAAVVHPVITITVVSKGMGWLKYKMFWDKAGRTHTFKAQLSGDYRIIELMQVGSSYAVMQSVNPKTKLTHWNSAAPFHKGDPKPTSDVLKKVVASANTPRVIRSNVAHELMVF